MCVCPFDYKAFAVSGKVGIPSTGLTTPVGWLSLPQTDRPKSVCNRCVIEVFGGVLCVVTLLFGYFCQCRGFCHRTESDLFLFLLIEEDAYIHELPLFKCVSFGLHGCGG